jgi:nitroreductase
MNAIARRVVALFPPQSQQAFRQTWRDCRARLRLLLAYRYDWTIYRRHAGLLRHHAAPALEARLIKAYHRVEKGLALPAPRPGFGRDAVAEVLACVDEYTRRFGPNHSSLRALNTLDEYVRFNRGLGVDVGWMEARLRALAALQSGGAPGEGGTLDTTRAAIHAAARIDLDAFFAQRYSVRQFSSEPVDPALIERAVWMAKKTPSVCNRESGSVFVASDPARKKALLALQNGNSGFGDSADRIMVITSRLDSFLSVGERNQCWIDGGLFAMSLIYALHSLGLGSCCLNWSVEPAQDRALKQAAGIPEDHAVIMLLAVGNLPEQLRVAQSPRRPLSDVLHFI